ncbi:hypothetical protein PENDEC_c035G06571 [Penicillium decumbens]|uniref:Uncharacterized protein n=1 Tax=Penicillium decumbens TaxID=69771 RepID=A0A1V6NUP2_PENDC|nr:hypothetical protein PENDEC_c035G06571 [Penicillium decumbens]
MSSSPGAAAKPEKTMSSRLLTMKFMQRAAATAAVRESLSGSDDKPPTPKRARLSTEAESPGTPETPQAELDAINAALKAEDEKRREALSRQAAEAGETEWVLDIPATSYPSPPMVVAADSLDAEGNILRGGRKSFGNFKRKPRYVQTQAGDGGEVAVDMEDQMTDITDPAQRDAMIERQKARAETRAKIKNNTHNFKLSDLTSISGGGGRMKPPQRSLSQKKQKNKKRKSH